MNRNGKLALKTVIIEYHPQSKLNGLRAALANEVPVFKKRYPSVEISVRPRTDPKTGIVGVYRDGSHRTLDMQDVCQGGVYLGLVHLASIKNDPGTIFRYETAHRNMHSVQGRWNPWLWLADKKTARFRPPAWDRKLSEEEWDYYVERYSQRMKEDEEAIAAGVDQYTSLPAEHTREVNERWEKHAVPGMQTDLETNVAEMKKMYKKRKKTPKPVSLKEFSLFSVPSHSDLGEEAVVMLRRNEMENLQKFWKNRKEELKRQPSSN